MRVWDGSSWVDSSPHVWNGSSWVQTTGGFVWNGSSWQPFHSVFSLDTTPTTVTSVCQSRGTSNCTATTNEAKVIVTGGVSPINYSWQFVSGVPATINSPLSGNTTFSRNALQGDFGTPNVYSGVYRCRVTDGTGEVLYSNNVTVTTTHRFPFEI